MDYPIYSEFQTLAGRGNLIPVYRELDADLETPVSVYLKLRGVKPSSAGEAFLLESVEGGEQLGRYSFIATSPARIFTLHGEHITIRDAARDGDVFARRSRSARRAARIRRALSGCAGFRVAAVLWRRGRLSCRTTW